MTDDWEIGIRGCVAGMAYVGELGVGGLERPGEELARPFSRTLGTPATADMTKHHQQNKVWYCRQ